MAPLGKGHMPPIEQIAELAFESQDADTATFEATFEGKHKNNPYNLFVRMDGHDASGVAVSRSFEPCRWNEIPNPPVGTTCQVVVDKNIDPSELPVRFTACVVDVTTPGATAPIPGCNSNQVLFDA